MFSQAIKDVQTRRGSRAAYAKVEARGGWAKTITPDLEAFLAAQTTAYLATAGADGQPYIQHRGGPAGFLRVLDEHTLAWVEYTGNRQYITTGNLAENPKVCLFVMDYAHKQRVKLWGTARVVENDPALIEKLMPTGYDAKPEQALIFTLVEWDGNCPQHIPQKVDVEEVAPVIAGLRARIAQLEAQIAGYDRGIEIQSLPDVGRHR
jgi:predicted pyridoxine 5'-phosphate oxidase superfamily flavin-nucleotide-binding protein